MADERKARLAALAARARRNQPPIETTGISSSYETNNHDDVKPALSFRNYVPKDANLEDNTSSADNADENQQFCSTKRQKTNNYDGNEPKSALELALAKTNRESREAAGQNVGEAGGWSKFTPISTKKVNWDLKRDIQQKTDRLERRTQKAIVELLRERLEKEAREGGGDDDDDDDSDLD